MSEAQVENTVEEISDVDQALLVIGDMLEQNASEDDMIIALIQSGVKYARAGRVLSKVLESKGLKVSAKDRYAAASENLTNWGFAPQTWDDVDDAVTNLVEELEATNAGQALSCVKRFAKEHEITLPERPKTGTGRARGASADSRFYAFAIANKEATADQIGEFVASLGVTEAQAPRYLAAFQERIDFARKFAAA